MLKPSKNSAISSSVALKGNPVNLKAAYSLASPSELSAGCLLRVTALPLSSFWSKAKAAWAPLELVHLIMTLPASLAPQAYKKCLTNEKLLTSMSMPYRKDLMSDSLAEPQLLSLTKHEFACWSTIVMMFVEFG